MQHQRSPPSHQQSFPEQLDPSQTYQHSINNTGAQRELRHQGQEHYDSHSIRRSNEFYLGSRTSLYRTQSTSRHSMMALDQFQSSPQLSQQQQQQQQQGLRQDSSYQHRPPYPYYPQQQQKQQAPHPPNQHPYYQRQYQPASLPSFRPPPAYEPYGLDDYEQQDYENHRTLSLNNSGGRGGRSNVVSRPQSQFYRKVPPARFENLSLAEQARQEHQMRRQHYQQHYHQHRQQQQARLQSDFRHSSASSVKSNNIGRSAHDLAWERHCYYQQQQIQEDALAERKRIEYQQQVMAQRRLSSAEGIRQAPLQQRPSPLVRTSSLSRLSNSSTIVVAGYRSMMEKKADSNMTMAHNSSSVLSRSVSTSAVMETRIKTSKKAEKDGVTFKNKESPASENDAKSSSDCKFFRLLKKSDSKFSKSTAPSVTVMNTETSSALTQIQNSHINGSNVTSRDQYTTPKIIGQPFESVSPVPKPATGLSRKKTLKELAGSLARRCSSRFNNSSRPSSFAGSNSDPVIRFTQGDQFLGGGSKSTSSLSLTTDFAPLHLTFSSLPRSLAPGPDGVVDLQQAIAASQGSSSISTSSPSNAKYSSTPFTRASPSPIESPQPQQYELQGQRVPIHRKVTLFRSKTISLPKSPSRRASHAYTDTIERTPSDSANNAMASNDNDDDTSNNNNNTHSTRANSLPTRRRQRDSLRLANGHGLNFDAFLSPTLVSNISTVTANSSSVEEEANAVERSTNDLESALPGLGLGRVTPLPAAIITNGQSSDIDQQQKARRQIISLLALGRKDRNTGKTSQSIKSIGSTSSSSTPTTATTPITPLSQLSPLALEAQDDLFVEKNSSDASTNGGEKKENEEIEKIAFMLVPKSRYEFQPLVVA
ncbi:hypothetical protein FBU30_009718 [Linnemannia zychae]|nr:hypothetical protein FBU30_009718 [Linnemannia zychae]